MPFNVLDLGLAALLGLAGFGGWRLGLITRSLSWAGMALGLALGARAVPAVIDSGRAASGRGELALIAVAILLAGAFIGQALGLVLGNRLNLAVRTPAGRRVDSIGGALAGALGVLVSIWLVLPAAADIPGWPSRTVRESTIAQAVTDAFPPAPDATLTLRRLLGESYPQVFDALRPTKPTGPPPAASGISPAVSARVVRSIVKVLGTACDHIQEGSGFAIGDGLVVTNAHVVAGERSTTLQRSDGSTVRATVISFDPGRDLALLSAPDLARPGLAIADVQAGGGGAVYGHPGGGPLTISPFRVGERIIAVGTDIYDRDRTRRDVLVLASNLAPGDSGSALVDPRGRVVGVAFAIAPDRPGVAYALSTDELRPFLAAPRHRPTDTGACVA